MRLQQILFFRELGFPLREIRDIMENPSFDARDALEKQRELLEMKRRRISGLIRLVDQALKGEQAMSFQEFDESKIEEAKKKYASEVKERWGSTEAYAQSEAKTARYTKEDWRRGQGEAEEIFRKFAAHMEQAPDDPAVQALVREWQEHITRNYYACTDEILAGLGEMYACDERFQKNLDSYAQGLAGFMSRAIRAYRR